MPVHDHILNIPQKRASNALQRLLDAYTSGELATEPDLLRRLTDEFATLYAGLSEPTITPEPMRVGELLRVSAIKRPMEQLDEDLELAYEQLERLKDAVTATANLCTAERAGLEELLAYARDRIIEAKAWSSDSDPTFLWASDTMKTMSKIDPQTSARVDNRLGIVTLAVTGEVPLSDKVSLVNIKHTDPTTKCVDALPGNWLEVATDAGRQVMSEMVEPVAPTFTRDSLKDSSNPANMFDGDPATWFEWERYIVPNIQLLTPRGTAWVVSSATSGEKKQVFGEDGITCDYGWEYKIHWPGSDDTEDSLHWVVSPTDYSGETQKGPAELAVTLQMEVQFESPQPLSWIEVLPYFSRGDMQSYTIKSIQVSPDGVGKWTELIKTPLTLNVDIDQPVDAVREGLPVKNYTGTAVVPCPISEVKSLRFEFYQDIPYPTVIGHKYYLKTTVTQKKKSSWFGLKTSSSTTSKKYRVPTDVMNPVQSGGRKLLGWGSSTTITDTDMETFYDLLRAYRYSIGIADLGLFRREYSQTSRFVSRPHIFEKPVTAASIIVSEFIPEGWDSTKSWIMYEISHDGTTWQRVSPQNTEATDSAVVHFPATQRLYLRATLERPSDRPTESPAIEYYAIKAIPEGAV